MSGSLPESLLCFLQEAEGLKSVERTAWTSSGRRESTAEHSWRLALLAWGGFLLLTLLTRYVSLGSIYAAASFPVGTWLFVSHDRMIMLLSLIITALILWKHRANFMRLIHGKESKLTFHKKKEGV